METFNFKLTTESSGDIDHKVNETSFGDGYVQAVSVGINNKTATWTVTALGKAAYTRPIMNFIDRHQGAISFYWTPPQGEQGRYRTTKYKIQNMGSDTFRISATFTQSYGVDAKAPTGVNVLSVNGETPDEYGDVTLTAEDIGADAKGTATKAIAELKKEKNPFIQYALAEKVPDLDFVNGKFKEINASLTEIDTDVANLQSGLSDTNEYVSEVHTELETVSGELFGLKDNVTANTEGISSLTTKVKANETAIKTINEAMVKSVNGKTPDESGNVEVEAGGGVEIDDKQPSTTKVYSSQQTEQVVNDKFADFTNLNDKDKGAALVSYSEELDYPDNTIGNAIKNSRSGLPLFSVLWWASRDHVPTGYVTADGQELSKATYPDAAQAITDNKVPVVTNDVWLSNHTTRGCYVANSSKDKFRVPDYNGKQADSLGALFLRGDNGKVANGTIQLDALQNFNISNTGRASSGDSTNEFYKAQLNASYNIGSSVSDGDSVLFRRGEDSRFRELIPVNARVADETRPLNVSGCWIIKLFGAITNVGSADASQLASDYANLAARVSVLESHQQAKKFTIIYPNDGTEQNPANVTVNNRYVMDNPFPNTPVICQAETYLNNVWGVSGWIYASGGQGVVAGHIIETDKIIVQTGTVYIGNTAPSIGGIHGNTNNNIATAPCRVKIWRII